MAFSIAYRISYGIETRSIGVDIARHFHLTGKVFSAQCSAETGFFIGIPHCQKYPTTIEGDNRIVEDISHTFGGLVTRSE